MKAILGIKAGMSQVFTKDGQSVPVTVVKCEPNLVTAIKTRSKDGYEAVQLGIVDLEAKKATRPYKGQFVKAGLKHIKKHLSEVRGMKNVIIGDLVEVDIFSAGEYVDVTGISKGHGYSGVIAAWNQKIGPMSHGAGFPHRSLGSLNGARGGSVAQRIWKGRHMPGNWGSEQITTQNLEIIDVNKKDGIILIKGAIPGANKSVVEIYQSKKMGNAKDSVQLVDLVEAEQINHLIEEAKQYGISFDVTATVAQMQAILVDAEAKRAAGIETHEVAPKEEDTENKE